MRRSTLKAEMAAGEPVSQAAVDTLVISFMCDNALPFSVVEDKSFKQLVTTLQPQIKVISTATVTERIRKAAEDMKNNLIEELGKVKFVATTADCWLANQKQYLGVTCHWIDEESLERKSAALACKRLRGPQTFDKLGRALYKVHCQYQIEDKVVRTTTDNGRNFIKAFKSFGAQNVAQVDEDEAQADAGSSEYELMLVYEFILLEIGNENEEDQDTDSNDDEDSSLNIRLPPHQPCACHLLNLVVTKDAAPEKLQESPCKELFLAALAKCKGIWNKTGQSHLASEVVEDTYGLKIISPKATRWNSTYLAFERIVRLIDKKGEEVFKGMCEKIKVKMLSPEEVAFLREYCATVRPLEIALKTLQSESKIWLGSLLPEIYELQSKLTRMETSSKFYKPLIRALQEGLTKRFAQMMKDPELAAAAILLPKFKTNWTDKKDVIDAGFEYVRQHVGERELTRYLDHPGKGIEVLHSFPAIKKLPLRLNTALPASAACERLLSTASQVFTSRRGRANPENLENQLLLKVNKAFRK